MTPFKRKSFAILRKLYPFITALLTCIVGYIGIYYYAYTKGHNFTLNTNHSVISKLDDFFTSLQATANAVSSLVDLDCKTLQPSLQKIIAKAPIIKSINLLKDDKPYCSTNGQMIITKSVSDNRQLLQKDAPNSYLVFWGDDLLLEQTITNNNHQYRLLIDIVDYQLITDILAPALPDQVITLKLHNRIITSQGLKKVPLKLYLAIEESSFRHYNYTVQTGYTSPLNLAVLFQYHTLALLIITLLTILSYGITQWFIRNISSAYYELNAAINNNQIKAYAQPIFSSQTGELIGIEILARWHHHKLGTVSPDIFIPVAEKTGLIIPLTQKLIKEVAQTLLPYGPHIPTYFHVGFNIAREHCESLQLVEDCKQFYKLANNNSIVLVIEITERELITVTSTSKQLFQELHKLHVKIALDDFGVGNSNLSYLNDFAIDYLKIDKSFISRIGSDALSKNILDSIIDITRSCHVESCAEGIETKAQADYLIAKGVTYLQGFYFAEPLPIKDFVKSEHFQKLLLNS